MVQGRSRIKKWMHCLTSSQGRFCRAVAQAGVWEELSMALGVFISYDTNCHIPQNETTRLLAGLALLNVNIASQIWLI